MTNEYNAKPTFNPSITIKAELLNHSKLDTNLLTKFSSAEYLDKLSLSIDHLDVSKELSSTLVAIQKFGTTVPEMTLFSPQTIENTTLVQSIKNISKIDLPVSLLNSHEFLEVAFPATATITEPIEHPSDDRKDESKERINDAETQEIINKIHEPTHVKDFLLFSSVLKKIAPSERFFNDYIWERLLDVTIAGVVFHPAETIAWLEKVIAFIISYVQHHPHMG
ncbi:hypothetical protein [Furfurilactobacillus entadae]|uniref:hypothetical protein n=1 Tax=Furfurilactobacillus entadae TaxID=2922307 RepID=UPI0035E46D5D